MKKFLAGIAAAAIITVPMTSFALESMSKGALKKATGQAGVSIAIDNVVIVQKTLPTTIFWDMDGTSSIMGTVGANTKTGIQISYEDASASKLIILDGILNADKYGTDELNTTFGITGRAALTGIGQVGIAEAAAVTGIDPSNGDDLSGLAGVYRTGISPLSIDVGTCQSLTAGLSYNRADASLSVAGVVIGLPTLEITTYHTNDVKIISVVVDDAGQQATTANSGTHGAATPGTPGINNVSNEMIRIEKAGVSQMAILGGRLEIAPH